MKEEIFEYEANIYTIIIGKNKNDNFAIIDESVETDVWFHVENEPSCHVILQNTSKLHDIPKQVIKRCAYLCKINSKAKTQKKSIVIYTTINNVIKTDIPGQVTVTNVKSVFV
jgi:predicted ribosome quality control (RQC) complex YloA/Tae2 family protein